MNVFLLSQLLFLWIILISVLISTMLENQNAEFLKFYRIGPQDDLIIIGISINNYFKYFGIIFYCIINSIFRTIHTDIIYPWIINNIQDETVSINYEIIKYGYIINIIHTTYYWFDWFIYMNLLLSQVDLLIIETLTSVVTSCYTTHRYIKNKSNENFIIL